ncbi:putative 3-oxo-5-alpha-steroid 4-dehydrogenase 2-like [Scophthalmus maximus]|uniref:Putative 3-oxo-5-alpha-steroid 4-dehydrogenase 2-like n=1 Tax=Scophthalmus maximus TaxID=52904 RepID=A0A2U9BN98_SCOMX|nr:putative 3-oxo-5-alpha-steroid 4-dehydrogenase 2-like [Scophthalmus maximus]
MECLDPVVFFLSGALITGGALFLWAQTRRRTAYGRYVSAEGRCCPARLGWFLQEDVDYIFYTGVMTGRGSADQL